MPRGRGGGRGGRHNFKGQKRHFTNEEQIAAEAEKEKREQKWKAKQDGEDVDESSSSEEETDDEKHKGVQHLIQVANPNREASKATRKVTELKTEDTKPQLSRREKEEIEKVQAKAHYQNLHMQGKTDEARADLARLAIIRKQRDDAARKRETEQKAKDESKALAEEKMKQRIQENRSK